MHWLNLTSHISDTFFLITAALFNTYLTPSSWIFTPFGWFFVWSGTQALQSGSKCQTFPMHIKTIGWSGCFEQFHILCIEYDLIYDWDQI